MYFNRELGKFTSVPQQVVAVNDKILVLYITNNDRFFVFEKFLDEMKASSQRDKFHILIVNTDPIDNYSTLLSSAGVSSTFVSVPCPKNDYLPKIRYGIDFAKRGGFKYIMIWKINKTNHKKN